MKRLPDGARFDVCRLKSAQELVALAARGENGYRQPMVRFRRRRKQVSLEVLCIPIIVRLTLLEDCRKPVKLRETDSGEDVAKAR